MSRIDLTRVGCPESAGSTPISASPFADRLPGELEAESRDVGSDRNVGTLIRLIRMSLFAGCPTDSRVVDPGL